MTFKDELINLPLDAFTCGHAPQSVDGWFPPLRCEKKSLVKYPRPLVRIEQARKALAEAKRIDEVKDIHDKAIALQTYAKLAKDPQMINDATDIRMRAEIKAGELLREMQKNKGAVAGKTGRKGKPVLDATPKLSDLGVSKTQSSRWQRLAAMPRDQQEATINHAKRQANAALEPNHVHGTEGTGEVERYTPPKYIEAARKVLGEIDLG